MRAGVIVRLSLLAIVFGVGGFLAMRFVFPPSPAVLPTAAPAASSPSTVLPTAAPATSSPPAVLPTVALAVSPPPTVLPTVAPAVLTPTVEPYVLARLNVVIGREGPGEKYPALGSVVRGERLEPLAWSPDKEWLQVCCMGGRPVWVRRGHVEFRGKVEVPVAGVIPPTPTPWWRVVAFTPTPTPFSCPYKYCLARLACNPSWRTVVEGVVYGVKGEPVNGVRVVLSWQPDGEWSTWDYSGKDPEKPGEYILILAPWGARPGTWYVWLADEAGERISEMAVVVTDSGSCMEARVDFAP